MISINPARVTSPNRVATPSNKQPSAQIKTYTPPIAGLVTNTTLAAPTGQSALVLENFWPTARSIEPRGGTKRRCTIAGGVESLFQYRANDSRTYFAADTHNIYEFSDNTLDGTALTATITGQTNADYSTVEMQTDGGQFLTIVNGADLAQIYDGTSWQQVTSVSTPLAITGIATDQLSDVWVYRNRTFFIEKNTMNAWYLGVNSVAGAATKLPLAGVFNRGGSLLFGATFSSDSGSGLDDRCVFVTDQGEFALYSGGNPGDVNDWRLNGVYGLGKPLGKNSTIQVGGDLVVATEAGLIPISAATTKDKSQLQLDAFSRAIEPDWQSQVILSARDWRLVKWEIRNMGIVAMPNGVGNYCWAVNLETGAWTKLTGWTIGSLAVLGESLHYGDLAGNIYLCDAGGFDDGAAFECRACFSFDHLGQPGAFKTAHTIKGTWRHEKPFSVKHSISSDYNPVFGAAPSVPVFTDGIQAEWDASDWDQDFWASNNTTYTIYEQRESMSAHGETLAPQVQVTSAQDYKLDCELISIDLLFSSGGFVT